MSFTIISIVLINSSFVKVISPFNWVWPIICWGVQKSSFNWRSIYIFWLLLVFVKECKSQNHFIIFSFNIVLFHNIFFCIAWKNDHTIYWNNFKEYFMKPEYERKFKKKWFSSCLFALLCSLSDKYPWERHEPSYPPSYGLNSTTTVLLDEWLWQ